MSEIPELAKKLITATTKGDFREMRRITNQITEIEKPHSFSETWNYENKPPEKDEAEKDGFMKHWNYAGTKGE